MVFCHSALDIWCTVCKSRQHFTIGVGEKLQSKGHEVNRHKYTNRTRCKSNSQKS